MPVGPEAPKGYALNKNGSLFFGYLELVFENGSLFYENGALFYENGSLF